MSKYLSVEEEQTFWAELFAITARYRQRRGFRDETLRRGVEVEPDGRGRPSRGWEARLKTRRTGGGGLSLSNLRDGLA
jgi:hypothetical protein